MKAKLLSFIFFYFFESGLFNGLRAIQIKNSVPSLAPAKRSGLSHPSSPSSIERLRAVRVSPAKRNA
jgi:hypothetical protein